MMFTDFAKWGEGQRGRKILRMTGIVGQRNEHQKGGEENAKLPLNVKRDWSAFVSLCRRCEYGGRWIAAKGERASFDGLCFCISANFVCSK